MGTAQDRIDELIEVSESLRARVSELEGVMEKAQESDRERLVMIIHRIDEGFTGSLHNAANCFSNAKALACDWLEAIDAAPQPAPEVGG